MPPPRKKSYPVPLADLVGGAVDPLLAKQGFGQASLILRWEDLVGDRLAACCQPIKLQWPRRPALRLPDSRPEPATLVLRVSGAMALEVQHMTPLIIERVNAHLGWRAVEKIALRQGPLEKRLEKQRAIPPDAEAVAAAEQAIVGVDDPALRAALTLLGARALRGKAGKA